MHSQCTAPSFYALFESLPTSLKNASERTSSTRLTSIFQPGGYVITGLFCFRIGPEVGCDHHALAFLPNANRELFKVYLVALVRVNAAW
jgi:hypothetical protein